MLCCQTFAYNFTTGTDIRVISLRPYSTPPVSQKNRTLTRKGKKKTCYYSKLWDIFRKID